MGDDYSEIRKRLFSVLSSALEEVRSPSGPAQSGPPVGGQEEVPSCPSRSSDVEEALNRLDAKLSDLEALLMDLSSQVSSASPSEQYVLDVLDRVQHLQTMVADVYKKTADFPAVAEELADLKSSIESLRAELRDVSSQLRTVLNHLKDLKRLGASSQDRATRPVSRVEKWGDLV